MTPILRASGKICVGEKTCSCNISYFQELANTHRQVENIISLTDTNVVESTMV